MNIILLGATGTTGQLVLEQLYKQSIRPILVGRNKKMLITLSKKYDDLVIHIANVQNSNELSNIINKGDLLISTVGPFNELGRTPLRIAIEKGAHYIDSNGEPTFISYVYKKYEEQLKNSKSLIMTGSGFDYIPGLFIGSKLAHDLGNQVSTINITYTNRKGKFANLTTGTISSLISSLTEQGTFYNNNDFYKNFLGAKSHSVTTDDKPVKGISVAGTEGFELPKSYPHLSTVNVFLGWFGNYGGIISKVNKVQHKLLKIRGC